LFNFFRHYKSPPFHFLIRIHLISLSYHISVVLPSHFSFMEQMLMLIRCEFNRKSKCRTWNRKRLNLTLQMEHMWNFNGIRISFASNNIEGRMLVQDDVRVGEKFKMAAGTGSRYEITYISACIYMIATKFQRLNLCFWCQATRMD